MYNKIIIVFLLICVVVLIIIASRQIENLKKCSSFIAVITNNPINNDSNLILPQE